MLEYIYKVLGIKMTRLSPDLLVYQGAHISKKNKLSKKFPDVIIFLVNSSNI